MDNRTLLLWSELATVTMVALICSYFLLACAGWVRPPVRGEVNAATWRQRYARRIAPLAGGLLFLNTALALLIWFQLRGG
jgi:hypothetical protein